MPFCNDTPASWCAGVLTAESTSGCGNEFTTGVINGLPSGIRLLRDTCATEIESTGKTVAACSSPGCLPGLFGNTAHMPIMNALNNNTPSMVKMISFFLPATAFGTNGLLNTLVIVCVLVLESAGFR